MTKLINKIKHNSWLNIRYDRMFRSLSISLLLVSFRFYLWFRGMSIQIPFKMDLSSAMEIEIQINPFVINIWGWKV